MITTRTMPAPLPAHHRRVATEAAIKNDFAEPLARDATRVKWAWPYLGAQRPGPSSSEEDDSPCPRGEDYPQEQ